MSMVGATFLSVLVVCLVPVVIAFFAAELDEINAIKNGNHK